MDIRSVIRWRRRSCLSYLWIRHPDGGPSQSRFTQQDGPICKTLEQKIYLFFLFNFVLQVQFLYALAILLSVPLQLFPAIRILENGILTRSGKVDPSVKWTKNIFRWFLVFFTTAISSWGAADLDKFVAFVGCFAWCVISSGLRLHEMDIDVFLIP